MTQSRPSAPAPLRLRLLCLLACAGLVARAETAPPAPTAAPADTAGPAPAPAAAEPPAAGGRTPPAELEASAEAAGLLHLAEGLTGRGDYASAEIAYRQILTQRKFDRAEQSEALIGLARMYRRQGVPTKAAAIYEKFLKEFPDDGHVPDVLLDLGRTLRDMGAYRLAISRFYSVINSTLKLSQSEPDHYQLLAHTAQFEIAETHFTAGNYAEASKFFMRLRLLDLAPVDRARATFKAAFSQQLAGDYETAVQSLRTYLQQWPDDEHTAEAHYLLAVSLRKLGRNDESLAVTLELLRNARAQSGSDPRGWAYWQRRTGNQLANDFFQNGQIMEALSIYDCLAGLSPDPAWRLPVTYQVALCYERMRDPVKAGTAYRAVIDGAGKLGANAGDELKEFARMSAWHIDHLAWDDQVSRQLTAYFKPKPPAADASVPSGSPAAAPIPVQ